ncbi:aspartyl-tRNA synthetase [Xanthobacter versatilis]|uniref:Aspartate--tRNA(Asp/Asn) ligase n=1 Tax=Xanthobacter autotrophicus (strain ATCC BAA-1158 / Py2) TaxID=78245 RepID=SYDND_XANP2|nr:RecName: Full=Aspartate--tRNA(Asp/Asn) ligase; AltName: Full=Aspartyl-tRNA synthetase; Short=AspRS; AltName: Full=Non-discriminating aspartyl-tRNA synthetase; Short=ND-AspRS [Xanthobacter autotrophicus Py2]ABS68370.1 aspartyl-tRNA synthetase [Xanthobacter autotrophicus Py2]
MHRYRSHTCGALSTAQVGEIVRLSGWCHRIRDHGGVLFIDLRDHYGLTQVVVDPDSAAFKDAEKVRAEWVIRIDGKVRLRPEGTENPDLATGAVEVYATELEVLGPSAELPLPVFGDVEYPEETRLRYRFLDLRREKLHRNIMTRGAIIDAMRSRMKGQGFFEFQTPILTASSPEGARDFLVPSRLHPGKFYALPQAPQQYKQLIMMSGFDRYFQIAPCFRDEDPRADRLPGEFYQLDLEMSFVEQEDIFAAVEPVITGVFEQFAEGKPVTQKWPRIPYAESLRKYGTDKPDLRNPLVMQNVSEHFRGSGFKVFARMLEVEKNEVWAIPAPGGGSRAFCDRMNSWAQSEGQPGLGYIMWRDLSADAAAGGEKAVKDALEKSRGPGAGEGHVVEPGVVGAGPLANNIGPERTEAIRAQLDLKAGDAAFFVAGDPDKFVKFAGLARTRVGEELNLVDKDRFELAWIVDFPFYEYSEEEKKVDFSHNPFSMPQGGLDALNTQDPLSIKAFQYDIACNGYEIASGGIRNHRPEAMVKAFEIAGYDAQTVEERFGGMYRAFQYGAPPHGGMAAGVDRIVMLLCGVTNLREISLFPMNQQALDLLMGAPAEAAPKQLRELHIRPAPQAK